VEIGHPSSRHPRSRIRPEHACLQVSARIRFSRKALRISHGRIAHTVSIQLGRWLVPLPPLMGPGVLEVRGLGADLRRQGVLPDEPWRVPFEVDRLPVADDGADPGPKMVWRSTPRLAGGRVAVGPPWRKRAHVGRHSAGRRSRKTSPPGATPRLSGRDTNSPVPGAWRSSASRYNGVRLRGARGSCLICSGASQCLSGSRKLLPRRRRRP
jgi:hypothetical protein